jgi:2-polyprenyl-3-methyl-5-hydroxy-6-metoxy-1,4-benzoquinol methylase
MRGHETFDVADVFGDDFLHFHAQIYNDRRSDDEVEFVERILGLSPAASVLDVACGIGRISLRLAARGYHVYGIDIAPAYIDAARAAAALSDQQTQDRLRYEQRDMRDLSGLGEFDAVLCWSTSFGYFDDAGNRAALPEMARVL